MVSEAEETKFQLSLNGISLEVSGEREFVEEMYRAIMADIEEARRRLHQGAMTKLTSPSAPVADNKPAKSAPVKVSASSKQRQNFEQVVWVHRCTSLVNKIYMASPRDLRRTKVLSKINLDHLATLYVEGKLMTRILPQFERGQTLWAELTTAGRAKIAEASAPSTAKVGKDRTDRLPDMVTSKKKSGGGISGTSST